MNVYGFSNGKKKKKRHPTRPSWEVSDLKHHVCGRLPAFETLPSINPGTYESLPILQGCMEWRERTAPGQNSDMQD